MSNNQPISFWTAAGKALCVDLPYILDSVWRRTEFETNRLFEYRFKPGAQGSPDIIRLQRRMPVFWLFAATFIFYTYGPTFDAVCSLVGQPRESLLHYAVFSVLVLLATYLVWRWWRGGKERIAKRIAERDISNKWRIGIIKLGVYGAVIALVAPIVLLAMFHLDVASEATEPMKCVATIASAVPAIWQVVILLVALTVAFVLAHCQLSSLQTTIAHTAIFVLAGAALIYVAPAEASEAKQGPYLHVYMLLVLAIAFTACCAHRLARIQLQSLPGKQSTTYRNALKNVELFPERRVDPDVNLRRASAALAVGSLSHPLQLLLLPAFFVMMVPTRFMWHAFIVTLVIAAMLLMIGNLSSRWQQMVLSVRNWFLIGTPLAVSMVVIVCAGLRLAQFQYASTILDAAPFGVVFMWVAMAYSLFWWFEYSINSALSRELFRFLGGEASASTGRIAYDINARSSRPNGVSSADRIVALHGAGRFAAMGWFYDKTQQQELAFHTYSASELFTPLSPPDGQDALHDLQRRIQLYFFLVNIAVLAWALLYAWYFGRGDANNTVAPVWSGKVAESKSAHANLSRLLAQQADKKQPAIIIAASGGGTRAALFTASALEGIAKLKHAENIVLLSGVSGGGVASAYFYGHRAELLGTETDAWQTFKKRVAGPFIRDVMDGASELRLVSDKPLGVLLAESFERRLFAQGTFNMGSATKPALILNTSVTGHPQGQSILLRDQFTPLANTASNCSQKDRPYSLLSGGRLIFTNLQDKTAFPAAASRFADVRYPYEVVNRADVPLARAAALNANFPPVFPNARIDVPVDDKACPTRTYYITDGGATENLGLISALYALRSALKALPPASRPVIHIVAIEASATGYDYAQDRGVGAALNSKERLGGGLTEELLTDICTVTGSPSCDGPMLKLHYLAMPLVFRSRGGFGTHWMLPKTIDVANPRMAAASPPWQRITGTSQAIDPEALSQLWSALHHPHQPFCEHAFKDTKATNANALRVIAGWICGADDPRLRKDLHVSEWQDLVQSLKAVPRP